MQWKTYSAKSSVVKVGDTVICELDNVIEKYTILREYIEWETTTMGGPYGQGRSKSKSITVADLNKGEISEITPLAKSMLGKRVGENFSYNVGMITHFGVILKIN